MTIAQARSAEPEFLEDPCFVRAPNVLWRSIPGVAVVVLRDVTQDTVVLTGTALALWEELEQPRCLDDVVVRLATRYGVTPDVVLAGVTAALADLRTRGMVRHHDD